MVAVVLSYSDKKYFSGLRKYFLQFNLSKIGQAKFYTKMSGEPILYYRIYLENKRYITVSSSNWFLSCSFLLETVVLPYSLPGKPKTILDRKQQPRFLKQKQNKSRELFKETKNAFLMISISN